MRKVSKKFDISIMPIKNKSKRNNILNKLILMINKLGNGQYTQ